MADVPPPSPNPSPRTETLTDAIATLHKSLDEAIAVWKAQPGQSAAMIAMALQGARGQIPATPATGASDQAAWQRVQQLRSSGFLGPQVAQETSTLLAQQQAARAAEQAEAVAIRRRQQNRRLREAAERAAAEEEARQQRQQAVEQAAGSLAAKGAAAVARTRAADAATAARALSQRTVEETRQYRDYLNKRAADDRDYQKQEAARSRLEQQAQAQQERQQGRLAAAAATSLAQRTAREDQETAAEAAIQQRMRAARAAREPANILIGQRSQLQDAAQQAQALATYGAAPGGQQVLQQQAQARQRLAAAQEADARNRATAEFGRLGGVVVGAQQAFAKLNPAIAVVTRAIEMGAFASPTHGATLKGSFDVLQARMGQAFLPLMDALSLRIQQISDAYSRIQPAVNAVGRVAAAGIFGTPGGGFLDRRASTPGQRAGESIVRSFTAWVGETIEQRAPKAIAERRQEQILELSEARAGRRGRFLQGLAATADFIGATGIAGVGEDQARGARLKRAYAGLPPAQMMGYEQFGQMATLAGLQMDELTAERYQQQLQALEDIKELLRDIRDRREGGREIGRW